MYAIVFSLVLSVSLVECHNLPMCGYGYYRCSGFDPMIAKYVYSKCIREDMICDGKRDCFYNEDEEDCTPSTSIRVTISEPTTVTTTSPTTVTTTSPTTVTTTSPTTHRLLPVTTEDNSSPTQKESIASSTNTGTIEFDLSTPPTSYDSNITTSTQTIDTSIDNVNRDYFELIVAVVISFSTVAVLIYCVVCLSKRLKRKRRRELSGSHRVRTMYGNKLV